MSETKKSGAPRITGSKIDHDTYPRLFPGEEAEMNRRIDEVLEKFSDVFNSPEVRFGMNGPMIAATSEEEQRQALTNPHKGLKNICKYFSNAAKNATSSLRVYVEYRRGDDVPKIPGRDLPKKVAQ